MKDLFVLTIGFMLHINQVYLDLFKGIINFN